MIGEEQERRRRRELLTLKEHRGRWTDERERRQRAKARGTRELVQAASEGRVRDLVVVFEIGHETVPRQIEIRLTPALPLPRIPLSLIEIAVLRGRNEFLRRTRVIGVIRFADSRQ